MKRPLDQLLSSPKLGGRNVTFQLTTATSSPRSAVEAGAADTVVKPGSADSRRPARSSHRFTGASSLILPEARSAPDRPEARSSVSESMRLHVLSDLHLERGIGDVPVAEADVVVLAGDISTGTRGVEWARSWAADRPLIYVAGNHEFYGHSMPRLIEQLRSAAAGSSVHVLEDEQLILDGVRFLGCTLWSDFDFDGPERRSVAMRL